MPENYNDNKLEDNLSSKKGLSTPITTIIAIVCILAGLFIMSYIFFLKPITEKTNTIKQENTIKTENTTEQENTAEEEMANTNDDLLNNHLDSLSNDMKRYMIDIGQTLSKYWDKSDLSSGNRCTVEFTIAPDGTLKDIKIAEKTSNEQFYDSVKSLFSHIQNVGIPPEEYKGERIRISFQIIDDKTKIFFPRMNEENSANMTPVENAAEPQNTDTDTNTKTDTYTNNNELLNNHFQNISPDMRHYLVGLANSFNSNLDKQISGIGICMVEFTITPDGTLENIEMASESPNKQLNESAKSALLKTQNVGIPPKDYNGERIRIAFGIRDNQFKLFFPQYKK